MRGAFASAGVDMSDEAWAIAFASSHLARCGKDAWVHTGHSWLVTALAEIISEVRGALGVGVEVLLDPTMLVQLLNGNDGLPADVGLLHSHGLRGSKLALDAVVSGLFGVSSPPSPEVALRHDEKTKFEKYSERVRSRSDIRFIPFPITEFGTLVGHAAAFFTEMARQTAASACDASGIVVMHVGKLLSDACGQVVGPMAPKGLSRRPCCSCGQHVARFFRRRRRCGGRFFLAWMKAFSCHGALYPRHGPQASPCVLERRVRRRLSPPRVIFSELPRSFVGLICYVCAQCSASFCRALDSVIFLPLLPFCFPARFPCLCSCCFFVIQGMIYTMLQVTCS
jgi:hypothetical protein